MRVYLAGPMLHITSEEMGWMDEAAHMLGIDGIECIKPQLQQLYGEKYLLDADVSSKVLTIRDRWAATGCDVVLMNFTGATKGSIGASIELGWADMAGVPVVAAIPAGNIHEHPMVLSIVSIRTYSLDAAVRSVLALRGARLQNQTVVPHELVSV